MSCFKKRKLNCLKVWCFLCVCVCEGVRDASASCDVMVRVKKTTVLCAPSNSLTLSCPVQHCGESLHIIWCKLHTDHTCVHIDNGQNVEIRQTHDEDRLFSSLTFKNVSFDDDGLYRCAVIQSNLNAVGHYINISVSANFQGVECGSHVAGENLVGPAGEMQSRQFIAVRTEEDWVPYFVICFSLASLVTLLTVSTMCFHKRAEKWTSNVGKWEETSNRMIPTLPGRTAPSAPVLQTHFPAFYDIYSMTTPTSFIPPTESQRAAVKNEVKSAGSNILAYTTIDHGQRETLAGNLMVHSERSKTSEYAVISRP